MVFSLTFRKYLHDVDSRIREIGNLFASALMKRYLCIILTFAYSKAYGIQFSSVVQVCDREIGNLFSSVFMMRYLCIILTLVYSKAYGIQFSFIRRTVAWQRGAHYAHHITACPHRIFRPCDGPVYDHTTEYLKETRWSRLQFYSQ